MSEDEEDALDAIADKYADRLTALFYLRVGGEHSEFLLDLIDLLKDGICEAGTWRNGPQNMTASTQQGCEVANRVNGNA